MSDFQILIEGRATDKPSEPCRLSIRLGDSILTRLVRWDSHEPNDWLEAPPVPLAFWFIDNWWRIRSEPAPHPDLNAEWRLAHHMSSVGAGFHWPNVSIWGEGSRVGVAVHADANNLQPSLKFVAQPTLDYVPSLTVEAAIDRFVRNVLEHVGDASDGLDAEYRQLQAERADSTVAAWRTLEAMLGFDPDDAPDGLVGGLEALTERYGSEPLQEAALAHQGEEATEVLETCIEAAESSNVLVRAPFSFDTLEINRSSRQPPWQLAVGAANQLRHWLGVPPGPIRNTRLSEIVGTNVDCLKTRRQSTFDIPYACGCAKKLAAGSPCGPPGRTRDGSNSAEASATSSGLATTPCARSLPQSRNARSSKGLSPRGSSADSPTFRRTSTPTNRARTTSIPQPATSTFPNT